jgi:hypothetical protein
VDFSLLYGGDEFSAKAASLELQGLRSVFEWIRREKANLFVPLMAVVDVRGYRILASSLLSLPSDSLKYGSDDGGNTVHRSNAVLNALMERCARDLNLKPHLVGAGTVLEFPADIEGHLDAQGRFFCLDTARLCCSERPQPTFLAIMIGTDGTLTEIELPHQGFEEKIRLLLHQSERDKPLQRAPFDGGTMLFAAQAGPQVAVPNGLQGRRLYNLLRPELIARNAKPLSSDCFTGFAARDPNRRVHEREAVECFVRLLREGIPGFAATHGLQLGLSVGRVSALLHEHGINARLLGVVRARLDRKRHMRARRVLLLDMIARAFKGIVRAGLRLQQGPGTVCALLNKLLTDDQFWTLTLRPAAEQVRSVQRGHFGGMQHGGAAQGAAHALAAVSGGSTSATGVHHMAAAPSVHRARLCMSHPRPKRAERR